MASGKQSFREHSATKILLEANPRNISASKISRYTVYYIIDVDVTLKLKNQGIINTSNIGNAYFIAISPREKQHIKDNTFPISKS